MSLSISHTEDITTETNCFCNMYIWMQKYYISILTWINQA